MQPFSVGAWRVNPDLGVLTRGESHKRLQPKVMEVLSCLVERSGDLVTREELLSRVWGERAVSDEPLTRCIAELRSAFEDSARKPQYIETLPKRGYRLIAPVQVSVSEPAEQGGTMHARNKKLVTLAWSGGIALLLIAAILAWHFGRTAPPTNPALAEPSLVVLPFANLSGEAEQDFLADGISATLTQVLSRDARLKVVAHTSASAFKGQAVDVREIGRKLSVSALLEGSVQRDENLLRVTAQLIDSTAGTTLWSASYDRPVDGLFELQDEIAAEVSTALQLTLLQDETARGRYYGARDFDAYLEYVRGLQALGQRTTFSLAFAIEQFRSVTEQDPTFALAWVGLAEAVLVNQWYSDVPLDEATDQADAALTRALQLEPDLGDAWSVLGFMEFKRANYEESEQAFRKAVALAPNNARAWFQYGTLLNDTGRPAEAIEKHRRSSLLDPMAPVVLTAIGVSLEKMGRFEEAMQQYRKVTEIVPGYPAAYDRLGMLEWSVFGRPDAALARHRTALGLDAANTWTRSLVAEMALGLEDREMAEAWVAAALRTGASKLYPNQSKALLMAYRGDGSAARMQFARRWLADAFTYADIDTMLRLYRDAALELGETGKALGLYREYLPGLFEDTQPLTVATFGPAIDVALLLQYSGDQAAADRLLGGAWEVIEKLPRNGCCGYGLADVEILAISGSPDEAVARLGEAYDTGYRVFWWWHTLRNPNLASLKDREDYRSVVDRFRQRAARERDKLSAQRLP